MKNTKKQPIIQPKGLILVKKRGEEYLRLKEIFAAQLRRLESYGYGKNILDSLKKQEELVIQAAIRISPDALIPFSPVIPKRLDNIHSQLYKDMERKYPRVLESLADRPYYIVDVISGGDKDGYNPINLEEGLGLVIASGAVISVATKNFIYGDQYDDMRIISLIREDGIKAFTAPTAKHLTLCKGRM